MALQQSIDLPVGEWTAPDFNLPGTDDKRYSLSDFSTAKGLVIVFTCNHCPYAKASWPLIIDLAKEFKDQGIQFVAINPNEPGHPEDSFAKMKEEVSRRNPPFPYLNDAKQDVAKAYKAQCTPDVYLFDADRKLYYHGQINDNWPASRRQEDASRGGQEPENAIEENLKDAIDSLLKDAPPPTHQPPSMGCSIKWS